MNESVSLNKLVELIIIYSLIKEDTFFMNESTLINLSVEWLIQWIGQQIGRMNDLMTLLVRASEKSPTLTQTDSASGIYKLRQTNKLYSWNTAWPIRLEDWN